MTARQVAEAVIAQMQHLGEEVEGVYIPDIAHEIPGTIKEMVMDVAQTGMPADRKLFQKSFSFTIVPVVDNFDTADMASAFAAAEKIYLHLPFPAVIHADSQAGELLWVADLQNLRFESTGNGFDHYSVDGQTIYINAEPELTGNITVKSFFFPLVTNLSNQHTQELIQRLLMKFGMVQIAKKKK